MVAHRPGDRHQLALAAGQGLDARLVSPAGSPALRRMPVAVARCRMLDSRKRASRGRAGGSRRCRGCRRAPDPARPPRPRGVALRPGRRAPACRRVRSRPLRVPCPRKCSARAWSACAILTRQPHQFARPEAQVDVVERPQWPEPGGEPLDGQQWPGSRRHRRRDCGHSGIVALSVPPGQGRYLWSCDNRRWGLWTPGGRAGARPPAVRHRARRRGQHRARGRGRGWPARCPSTGDKSG